MSAFQKQIKTLGGLSLLAAFTLIAPAQSTWTGVDGDWATAGNWSPSGVPNLTGGGTATINGGAVTYTAGPDLFISNGSTLQINGGSWTQAGGISWIQMSGGNLVVAGGTFNQGTAGNIVRNASSSITVSSGVANLSGNFLHDLTNSGTFTISGSGTVNIANEFKPLTTFTMSGGKLTANLISFADGPGGINLTGGTLQVNGGAFGNGIYGGGPTKGINFSSDSVGSVFINNFTAANLTSSNFLTNGTIQLAGAVNAGAFTIVEADGGVYVSLGTIPEPSTYATLAGVGVLGLTVWRRRQSRA